MPPEIRAVTITKAGRPERPAFVTGCLAGPSHCLAIVTFWIPAYWTRFLDVP